MGVVKLTYNRRRLEPVRGREQAGKRHVLIVSQTAFNQMTGVPIIAPITQGGNFARERGFTVPLSGLGLKTQGVVLCHQLRVLDLKARGGQRVESIPPAVLHDVIGRVLPVFEG